MFVCCVSNAVSCYILCVSAVDDDGDGDAVKDSAAPTLPAAVGSKRPAVLADGTYATQVGGTQADIDTHAREGGVVEGVVEGGERGTGCIHSSDRWNTGASSNTGGAYRQTYIHTRAGGWRMLHT